MIGGAWYEWLGYLALCLGLIAVTHWRFKVYTSFYSLVGNAGRFGYTGQVWLPEHGLHYYKARMYDPVLGRFLQTDPIGYAAGLNLYAYVGGDPVNLVDPLGLQGQPDPDDIVVEAIRLGGLLAGGGGGRMMAAGSTVSELEGTVMIVTCDVACQIRRIGRPSRGYVRRFNEWFHGRRVIDISGTSYCARACFTRDDAFPIRSPSEQLFATGSIAALFGTAVLAPGVVAFEGMAPGYALYGQGRVFQVRFFTDRLRIRLDVKPHADINIQTRNHNLHIPPG